MPLYEYSCEDCAAETTVLIVRTDEPTPVCSACASVRLKRLCSIPNVVSVRPTDGNAAATLSDPNGFVSAMRGLEASHGMSLTRNELDQAVGRLEKAKK